VEGWRQMYVRTAGSLLKVRARTRRVRCKFLFFLRILVNGRRTLANSWHQGAICQISSGGVGVRGERPARGCNFSSRG
jgi:hypothetical protein